MQVPSTRLSLQLYAFLAETLFFVVLDLLLLESQDRAIDESDFSSEPEETVLQRDFQVVVNIGPLPAPTIRPDSLEHQNGIFGCSLVNQIRDCDLLVIVKPRLNPYSFLYLTSPHLRALAGCALCPHLHFLSFASWALNFLHFLSVDFINLPLTATAAAFLPGVLVARSIADRTAMVSQDGEGDVHAVHGGFDRKRKPDPHRIGISLVYIRILLFLGRSELPVVVFPFGGVGKQGTGIGLGPVLLGDLRASLLDLLLSVEDVEAQDSVGLSADLRQREGEKSAEHPRLIQQSDFFIEQSIVEHLADHVQRVLEPGLAHQQHHVRELHQLHRKVYVAHKSVAEQVWSRPQDLNEELQAYIQQLLLFCHAEAFVYVAHTSLEIIADSVPEGGGIGALLAQLPVGHVLDFPEDLADAFAQLWTELADNCVRVSPEVEVLALSDDDLRPITDLCGLNEPSV